MDTHRHRYTSYEMQLIVHCADCAVNLASLLG